MSAHNQTVVITGASSGIGKATALHLDQLGFRVFAGVRKEADYQALKEAASDALTPIFLDVTDGDSIETAVRAVTEASAGKVNGMINNAGLSLNGPLELLAFFTTMATMDAVVPSTGTHTLEDHFCQLGGES